MPGRDLKPGDFYQDLNGKKYQIVAIAYDAETEEKCVVYQAMFGSYTNYIRKFDDFFGVVEYTEGAPEHEMRELKSPDDEGEVNPDLLAFLEADSCREKIEILERIQERISENILTESILCAIEASLDISYEEESLEERIYHIQNYLRTKERYEGTRLR